MTAKKTSAKSKIQTLFTIGYEKAKPAAVMANSSARRSSSWSTPARSPPRAGPVSPRGSLRPRLDEEGIAIPAFAEARHAGRRPAGGAHRRARHALAHLRQAPQNAGGASRRWTNCRDRQVRPTSRACSAIERDPRTAATAAASRRIVHERTGASVDRSRPAAVLTLFRRLHGGAGMPRSTLHDQRHQAEPTGT